MDRRDLLNGVNDFLTDSIVLPPGDFDKELLLPIIETAKLKKLNAKRRFTKDRAQHLDRISDHEHRSSQSKNFSKFITFHFLIVLILLVSKILLCKSINYFYMIKIFSKI